MKHLDLFSGIGGFALAARRVKWDTVGFCEIDPYCQKVLAKHWPGVPIYEDVTKLDGTKVGPVDIITGGFPCQDISVAGKQVGIDGERSGLWSELARIIGEVRPRYAVLENVSALLSGDSGRWFQRVLGDLAEIGFDAEWHCIPASSVGAPHRRDRVWIICYPRGEQHEGGGYEIGRAPTKDVRNLNSDSEPVSTVHAETSGVCSDVADTNHPRLERRLREVLSERAREWTTRTGSDPWDGFWISEPDVGQLVDGLPARLAGLRGLTDDQRWIQIPCEKTAEECLRDLRKHKNALRASHRQGLEEQRPIEFDDAVQFLSHIIASCGGRDNSEEGEVALQALRENVLSSGNVQHAPDEVQTVWKSIDDTAADWLIMATCLGRDWADSPIGRVAHGVPNRLNRLKGLGNAIVPQVAEVIFRAINDHH